MHGKINKHATCNTDTALPFGFHVSQPTKRDVEWGDELSIISDGKECGCTRLMLQKVGGNPIDFFSGFSICWLNKPKLRSPDIKRIASVAHSTHTHTQTDTHTPLFDDGHALFTICLSGLSFFFIYEEIPVALISILLIHWYACVMLNRILDFFENFFSKFQF